MDNNSNDEQYTFLLIHLFLINLFIVYFYNFQWKDYSDISKFTLLNMVKVIAFALKQGKVAIHCHAGLGRTGTLIAAYLIFTYRCKAQDAINFVRNKR